MQHFYGFRDLVSPKAAPCLPWSWAYPTHAAKILTAPKVRRQELITELGWLVYSAVRPLVADARVTADNPAAGLRGIVFDYDVPLVAENLETVLAKMPEDHKPQYVEKTLSGHFRLVWVFDQDVPVPDTKVAELVLQLWGKRIGAKDLHPGLDKASFKPSQVWTTGREWFAVGGPAVLPAKTLRELLFEAAKQFHPDTKGEVPLSKIKEGLDDKFPGAWRGPFELNSVGRRFWDPAADNPHGCCVKPDGFVCFTGPVGFVSWKTLLGEEWLRNASEQQLDSAVRGIWFDGRWYWRETNAGVWRRYSREDTKLHLQQQGYSDKTEKGATISDVGRLLLLIQSTQVVDAVVPLVNYRPGYCQIAGKAYVNSMRIRALEPSTGGEWPWLSRFLDGFFANPEDRPKEHFLLWLQRGYRAMREYRADPGQIIFLCGPKHNGKTLLNYRVLRPIFGGAQGDPFEYLMNGNRFNVELFHAYFWAMDDAAAPRGDYKYSVLSKLKSFAVNPTHRVEEKNQTAASLEHIGRMSITLNDDPGSLALLPEVNSNTRDKFSFFATQPYSGVWPKNGELERTLETELPHFCAWLLDWTGPDDLLENSRMGVASYFDSSLLDTAQKTEFAYNFLELLNVWKDSSWTDGQTEDVVTPTALMAAFAMHPSLAPLAREWRISTVTHCLTTLARQSGTGVSHADMHRRTFRITKT